MGRVLRYVAREMQPFELTWRCMQSRFLLRPGPEANRRIIGVIGQAMRLFDPDDVHLCGAFVQRIVEVPEHRDLIEHRTLRRRGEVA